MACRHNHLVPDLSRRGNQELWRLMEIAKHRLFYTLLELNLPLITRAEDPAEGLMFEFLEDPDIGKKVMTGHDSGTITISIAEADDAERERRRKSMHEPYRTLLGHFRHEIAHYYWDRLVRNSVALEPFRQMFGDDRADYAQALKTHYQNGAPEDWRERFVSAYATSHAWEDFAETFAHYLHNVDTLETADAFGVRVKPRHIAQAAFALNSLNRSMGLGDLYPFIITPAIIDKLAFIHHLVHGTLDQDQDRRPTEGVLAPVPTESPPP